ncbi:ABC transporter permease [Chloroflexi bacterium TSY]|nr:ABC transporter permease [Chloroflexi bacterium TSY]
MTRLILQRFGFALLTMVLVSLIAFVGTEALPGDSCTAYLGRDATPEGLRICRENRGELRPWYVKYAEWAGNILKGDLGTSMNGDRGINEIVGPRLRNTAMLAFFASIIGIPIAVLLGVITGLFRDRFPDVAISSTAIVAMTLPEFVTATILIYIFSIRLEWFNAIAVLRTNASFGDLMSTIALPVITLVLVMTAHILRMVRTSVIDVMAGDFVQMARLKGVPYWQIVFKHALPNALLPSIPVIALTIAWLLGGLVIIERVFNYPGLGNEMLNAIALRDIPVVLAIAMLLAGVYVIVNLISDLLTLFLNPKLRTMRT